MTTTAPRDARLQGKVLVITGGFGRLGAAVARAAANAGAKVAAVDQAAGPAKPVADGILRLGGVDLSGFEAADSAFSEVERQLGPLYGIVNIAGGFRWELFEQSKLDTWDLLYNLNLKTAVVASKAALPRLLAHGGGRIVNVGAAAAAAKAAAGMGAYTASKAGVAKFTESLADEFKDRGITVNAVLPSILDTPANRADMPTADFARWVTPEALAAVILFLLSDEAAAVTGALIPVCGRV